MRRAEIQFREAFERLKGGRPIRLPKGTRVTQNNVAKEAGAVPSALRSARFPELALEIQAWMTDHGAGSSHVTASNAIIAQRSANRDLRRRIAVLVEQRDDALAKLVLAETRIVELFLENDRLRVDEQPSNIRAFRGRKPGSLEIE